MLESWVAVATGAATLVAALAGWVKWLRPWLRNMKRDYRAGRDALIGRDAVVDSITGRELAPALPGIGQRMANVETAIVAIAQQQQDIADLKTDVQYLKADVRDLQASAAERIVSHVESAHMFKAMEAAIKAEPDEPAEYTD